MPWITLVVEPPAAYAHRYHGPVIERVLPLHEARRLCGKMGAWADACAWKKKGKCYIVIPRNGPVRNLSAYRRHEMAHCNGWSHGHGRYARGGHSSGNFPSFDNRFDADWQ